MSHKNLTLRIEAQVLLWARMRALRDGTSVNRRIRQYLDEYAAIPPEQRRVSPPGLDADARPAGSPGGPETHAQLIGRRPCPLPGAVADPPRSETPTSEAS
jgi:hypothetical protein